MVVALAVLIFSTLTAHARVGGWTSGGGDGLVCFGAEETALATQVRQSKSVPDSLLPKIKSIEALDLFLARQDDPTFEAIPLHDKETAAEYVDRLVDYYSGVPALKSLMDNSKGMTSLSGFEFPLRLELDPFTITAPDAKGLASKLGALGLSFPNCTCEIKLQYDKQNNLQELAAYVDPNRYINTPPNCAIVALARNYLEDDVTGMLDVVSVDQRLWNSPAFSELSKAALITHERVYTQGLRRNQLDSSETHEIVTALIRNNNRLSPPEFAKLLRRTGFLQAPAKNIEEHPDL